jgi:hypothetical protein
MRAIKILFSISLFLAFFSCNAQTTKEATKAVSSNSLEAYYFHFNARCTTCRTVEAQAQADIELLYPELVKSGQISFTAVNLDEPDGKTIGKNLGVSGQTLLLVKGEQKINITNEGFMYAVSQPDKLKSIIKEKVDGLLGI